MEYRLLPTLRDRQPLKSTFLYIVPGKAVNGKYVTNGYRYVKKEKFQTSSPLPAICCLSPKCFDKFPQKVHFLVYLFNLQ